jgi:triosephosphate isomerase
MRSVVVNIARMVLAAALIFSGFVKAIDPLGTQYKIQDYLGAVHLAGVVPDWITLSASIGLSGFEFCLGVFLLFAIRRRQVSWCTFILMVGMTIVTIWLATFNPIQDCGCFGDAIKMTNLQTLLKNIVLLAAAIAVWRSPLTMRRFISKHNQWIVINYTILFTLVVSVWSLYKLPLFDFRPYHVGADIKKGMEVPPGAELPQYETTFILEKDGEQREFSLEDYPDSTWNFIDARTELVKAGYEPPIHDFSIVDRETDEDITDEVLSDSSYTFLLVAPFLEHASDTNLGAIDAIYEYAQDHGYRFYGLTASSEKGIEHWRDITGAEYPFCTTDGTTLKTIVRSNPGLVLLHQGKVVAKWSHNDLPDFEGDPEMAALVEDASQVAIPVVRGSAKDVANKIVLIVLGYILPLLALTIADRYWAWTRLLQRKKERKETAVTPTEGEAVSSKD